MFISAIGISHKTAPLEEREQLAFSASELPFALNFVREKLGAGAILSTCNRTELYLTPEENDGEAQPLADLLAAAKGTSARLDLSLFYVLRQEEAVRHLFRVTAGIDSMILGEDQILGQVRDALAAANQAGALNSVLSRLFHCALRVGKRARTETEIGRYGVSVSSTAVELAERVFGQLSRCTVLVISAGESGKLAVNHLVERGVSQVLVTNRTYERARLLATRLGGQAVPFRQLPQALAAADIVISSTGAERFVVGPEEVQPALSARNGRPLLFVDIAVPRDIDPQVGALPGVHLFDIDDLRGMGQPDGQDCQREVEKVEAIVGEEAESFMAWWRSLDVVPLITGLHQRAEEIRRAELEKTLRRLPNLSEEERGRIEAMTAAIVKKLLHAPITRLRAEPDGRRFSEPLRELFGLSQQR
jgi:glutamyl-tRNA reductase